MKKEQSQIILLIVIILFGLGYAYIKFLFQPQWMDIQIARDQQLALENQYQELLTYQRNQDGLEQEIKTLEAQVDQLNAQIPKRLNKPQLMVELYTLAKQHTVDPQSITFEQAQNKGTYQELGMIFSCFGKTADLLAMIHDLQFGESQRLAIKSISLTGSQANMRADLKLTASASSNKTNESSKKPDFMNSSIGVDSPDKMFLP